MSDVEWESLWYDECPNPDCAHPRSALRDKQVHPRPLPRMHVPPFNDVK